jgi:hypothetical protein
MRKVIWLMTGAIAQVILTAGMALADGGSTLPAPGGDQVEGVVVHAPDGTAFTGADIGAWLMVAAALVVIGTVLVVAGRRRAAVH